MLVGSSPRFVVDASHGISLFVCKFVSVMCPSGSPSLARLPLLFSSQDSNAPTIHGPGPATKSTKQQNSKELILTRLAVHDFLATAPPKRIPTRGMNGLFLCILGKRSKDRSQSQKTLSEGKVSRGEVLDEQEAKTVVMGSKGFFNLGRDILVGDKVLVVYDDGFVL